MLVRLTVSWFQLCICDDFDVLSSVSERQQIHVFQKCWMSPLRCVPTGRKVNFIWMALGGTKWGEVAFICFSWGGKGRKGEGRETGGKRTEAKKAEPSSTQCGVSWERSKLLCSLCSKPANSELDSSNWTSWSNWYAKNTNSVPCIFCRAVFGLNVWLGVWAVTHTHTVGVYVGWCTTNKHRLQKHLEIQAMWGQCRFLLQPECS